MNSLKKTTIFLSLSLALLGTLNPVFCAQQESLLISPATKEQLTKEKQPSVLTKAIIGAGVSAAVAITFCVIGGATPTPTSLTIATGAGALTATFTKSRQGAFFAAAGMSIPVSALLLVKDKNAQRLQTANTALTTANTALTAANTALTTDKNQLAISINYLTAQSLDILRLPENKGFFDLYYPDLQQSRGSVDDLRIMSKIIKTFADSRHEILWSIGEAVLKNRAAQPD